MDARITMITLGVADVARSRRFYCDGLGWPASSASSEHMVTIDANGVVLALYGREALAADVEVSAKGSGFHGVALAHNVGSRDAVDRAMARAVAAGGRPLRPVQDTFWGGYSGYFADPDGFVWEVAWNPHWPLDADGRMRVPG
jgi:catechol 2,3-dioxygenase-like lactoylglutathione lyase family enzyme